MIMPLVPYKVRSLQDEQLKTTSEVAESKLHSSKANKEVIDLSLKSPFAKFSQTPHNNGSVKLQEDSCSE